MGATDEQLDFPHIYASGKNGWATLDMAKPNDNLAPLFDLIVDHVPAAGGRGASRTSPSRSCSVLIENDPFLGRLLTGRIESGKAVPGMAIKALGRRRQGDRTRPHHQGAGLPRPEAPADRRRRRGRRHRRHRRTDDPRPPWPTRCAPMEVTEALPAQPDRSADDLDDRQRQRQPAGRPRRRQGAEPRHPRPPVEGSRVQRRHPRHAKRPTSATPTKSPAAANCSWAC